MLQVMRTMAHSWPVKALMTLLIISFGIWGIGDMFKGQPLQRAVATVGTQKITVLDLEQRFQKDMPEARRAFGDELTTQQARQIGLLDRALDLLIKFSSVDQEAARLGLSVTDRLIIEDLSKEKTFQGKDGKFDPTLWRQALGRGGFTEKAFLEEQRTFAARRLLLQTIVNNFTPPSLLAENLTKARGARRIFEILSLKNAAMPKEPLVKDDDLKAYYDSHQEVFRAPEYRSMTVAVLSSEDIAKSMTITDEELKKAYEQKSEELSLPETRDLAQVVLQDEAKAKALSASVTDGKSIETAAKAMGYTAVPLKKVQEKDVLPELYTTVFSLQEGAVSSAIKSPMGWHVMQLKKINEAGVPSFESIKQDLQEAVKNERASDLIAKNINQLEDALAANKSLEDVADAMRLRLVKIPLIDAKQNPQAPKAKIEDFPSKNDAIKAAFALGAGESSPLIDDRKGNYVTIRVDEVTPAQIRPYDSVKDLVALSYEADKKAQKAAAKAEEIAKAARDGKKLSAFAALDGADVRFSKPVSMLGDSDDNLPEKAYAKLFQMKMGDIITYADSDRQFVIRLSDIHQIEPQKNPALKLKLVEQLKDSLPLESAEMYESYLHIRTPVKINATLLENLKKQEN